MGSCKHEKWEVSNRVENKDSLTVVVTMKCAACGVTEITRGKLVPSEPGEPFNKMLSPERLNL